MFDQTLYLAVPKTEELEKCLSRANPKLLSLLDLTIIEANDQTFIAKESPPYPTLEQLKNLESHLFSLIQRLGYTPKESRILGAAKP